MKSSRQSNGSQDSQCSSEVAHISGSTGSFPGLPRSGSTGSVDTDQVAKVLSTSRGRSKHLSLRLDQLSRGEPVLPALPDSGNDATVIPAHDLIREGATIMWPNYIDGWNNTITPDKPFFFWDKGVVKSVGERVQAHGTTAYRPVEIEFIKQTGRKATVTLKKSHMIVIDSEKGNEEQLGNELTLDEMTTYLGMVKHHNAHLWAWNDCIDRGNRLFKKYAIPEYDYENGGFIIYAKDGGEYDVCRDVQLIRNKDGQWVKLKWKGNECIQDGWLKKEKYFPDGESDVVALEPKKIKKKKKMSRSVGVVSEDPTKISKKKLKQIHKQREKDLKNGLRTSQGTAFVLSARRDYIKQQKEAAGNGCRRLAEIDGPSTTFTIGCILAAGLIGYFARRFFCKRRSTERKDEHCL